MGGYFILHYTNYIINNLVQHVWQDMLNKLKDLKYHLHGFLSINLKKFFNIFEWQKDHPINILTTAIS